MPASVNTAASGCASRSTHTKRHLPTRSYSRMAAVNVRDSCEAHARGSHRCGGMCEHPLVCGLHQQLQSIWGCGGDMWDMCSWSGLFIMFVFTHHYVPTSCGVNTGVNSMGSSDKPWKPPPYTCQGCVWSSYKLLGAFW